MWRFIVLTIAVFASRILGGEWDSRDIGKRCWENTSVTDPVVIGETVRMMCDPCQTQMTGILWSKEHGTWDKSNLRPVPFKVVDNSHIEGRYALNWDMSFSIYNVELSDAGRYRCSRDNEDYSWHQVIVYDTSEFLVADTRKGQRPLGDQGFAKTTWADWSPCSACDRPGTRERIGFCYLGEPHNPLKQYHNGIPCDYFSSPWLTSSFQTFRMDIRHQRLIEACSITCREADKQVRHKKVQPFLLPFKCMTTWWQHKQKLVVVYEGDTLKLKCHHCQDLYGGVGWIQLKATSTDLGVSFDWHDNDDENKLVLNFDMSMEIRRAAPRDADKYMCMRKEEMYSLNDVVVVRRPREMHVVDKTKGQKAYGKRDRVYTMWMEWGPCSACGKPGTRTRMGHCFSAAPGVAGMLAKQYPAGVPCHYKTLERFDWGTIQSPLLDEKMIDTCNEPCGHDAVRDLFASHVQRYAAARRPGQKNPWARPKGKPTEERVELKVYGYIGRNVSLVCPGASEYATTEWKNGSRMMALQQQGAGTGVTRGRYHIDDLQGSLEIARVASWDEQVYRCYSNGVQIATVRLVVTKPLIDVQTFKGTFLQMGNVLAFYSAIFVFVILLKCLARGVQSARYKRSLQAQS